MENHEAEKQAALQQAQKMLQAEQQTRRAQCAEAINSVLAEYRCKLAVQPGFSEDGRLVCPINIIVLP